MVLNLAAAVQLDCQVSTASGEVQLRSTGPLGAALKLHFRASVSCIRQQAAQSDRPSSLWPAVRLHVGRATGWAHVPGVRCTAAIFLDQLGCGSGWLAHPAVADNALQLGPATGDVGREDSADVTRVVAGIAAYAAPGQVGSLVNSLRGYFSSVDVPLAWMSVLHRFAGMCASFVMWCSSAVLLTLFCAFGLHLQVQLRGSAWTCTERAPMAPGGTIYTSHWLGGAAGATSLHIRDLCAKTIQLSSSVPESAAAVDRSRVIYETEWQAVGSHALTHASVQAVSSQLPHAACVLTQPQEAAMQFDLHLATRAAMNTAASGAAAFACAAHTVLLQTVVAQARRGSSMQLLTHGSQPVARTPAGRQVHAGATGVALGMQSMMRVAAQEFAAVRWGSADVGTSCPLPPAR